jgi:hypothetical protein
MNSNNQKTISKRNVPMEPNLCWYCEKRQFSPEVSVKYVLRRVLDSTINVVSYTSYNQEIVVVPRCRECAEVHNKLENISGGIMAVLGFFPLLVAIGMTVLILIGEIKADWVTTILLYLLGIGVEIMASLRKKKDRKTLLDIELEIKRIGMIRKDKKDGIKYPLVQEYLQNGFKQID